MSKFIDILEKCGCSETGKCNCEKAGKKCSGKCKCKTVKETKEDPYEAGYEVGFTKGGKRSDMPSDYTPEEKAQWKDGFKDGQYDRTTEYGKGMAEAKKDDDDYGDWKYHQKKDDKQGDKNSCCGSTKGFIKMNDGKLKCIGCSKVTEKKLKESKFEKYLMEQKLLNEEVDLILEKLGSLDAMDASDLGLPANTPITFDMLEKAFKKSGLTIDQFMKKIKSAFMGATSFELDTLKSKLEMPTGGSSSDMFGRTTRASDSR